MTITFSDTEIERCYNFAKQMIGKHHPSLIGHRDDMEIFRDDIRGKLGEVAIRNYILQNISYAHINGDIDFSVSERGIWDNQDLIVNGAYLSIKSIKPQSELLMIECKRYGANGEYVYKNNDGSSVKIDYYILVRVAISPDINWDDFKSKDLEEFCNPFKIKMKNGEWVKENKIKREFKAEVLGGISHSEFWRIKRYITKGTKLTLKNINAFLNGCDISNLPEKVMPSDKKNNILQEDNFIVHKNSLIPLNRLGIERRV